MGWSITIRVTGKQRKPCPVSRLHGGRCSVLQRKKKNALDCLLSFIYRMAIWPAAPGSATKPGMKRLVTTETNLKGGRHYSGKLKEPANRFNFFRDVAVLAFPVQAGLGESSLSKPVTITSSIPGLDAAKIFDPKVSALTRINRTEGGVYINLNFSDAFEARSISYQVQPKGKATTSATNVPGPPSDIFVGTGYWVLSRGPDI